MTQISRRRFLQAAGTAGVAAAAAPAWPTSAAAAAEVLALDNDPALHALRRFTFGPSFESVTALRAMPGQTTEAKIAAWFEQQLTAPPTESPDSGWDRVSSAFRVTTMSAYEAQGAYPWNDARAIQDTQAAACVRPVYSEWQLREVLVEFWSAHYSTFGNQDKFSRLSKATDIREVLRANALGTFRAMLRASAESPHMLNFLDNQWNRKDSPNENYARELLELHTLGADALYQRSTWRGLPADTAADLAAAEADVRNAARALTGWEFYGYSADSNLYPTYGLFRFKADEHETGALSVFDGEWTHPNATADQAAGWSLLDFLAGHPATAEHLCRKLCALFIDETYLSREVPATSGVLAAAIAAYLSPVPNVTQPGTYWPGTDLKAVLRVIRESPEFAASSGAKWRRPVELISAMLRALGAELVLNNHSATKPNPGGVTVREQHAGLAQQPYAWHTPEGFPEVWESWLGAGPLLKRWNAASAIVDGLLHLTQDATTFRWTWVKSWTIPTAYTLAGGPARPDSAIGVVRALTQRICLQRFSADHERALLAFLGFESTPDAYLPPATLDAKGPELLRLILSSPYFQLR